MLFQNKQRWRMAPFVAAILTLFCCTVTVTQANVITNGCSNTNASCTLGELVGGGSIVIDDKSFDNWFVDDFSTIPVITSGIQVLALDDQSLNTGLQFNANGQFSVTGLDLIDLDIGFSVSTLDGSARIKDNSLEINQFVFNAGNAGGFINIFEDVVDVNGNLIGEKFVTADNSPPGFFDLFDSASFSPQAMIFVETTILLGGDSDFDSVSLDRFTQRFSQILEPATQIPEPVTLMLIGIGLAGLGFARRK
jgi:PEP-CTERM motif-containing protein